MNHGKVLWQVKAVFFFCYGGERQWQIHHFDQNMSLTHKYRKQYIHKAEI